VKPESPSPPADLQPTSTRIPAAISDAFVIRSWRRQSEPGYRQTPRVLLLKSGIRYTGTLSDWRRRAARRPLLPIVRTDSCTVCPARGLPRAASRRDVLLDADAEAMESRWSTADPHLDSAQPPSTTGGIQPAPGFSHAGWEKAVREGRVILVHPPGQRLPLVARRLIGALRLVVLTVSSVRRRWFRASGSPSEGPRGGSTRRSRAGRS
jgi:hypothetical protein